MVKRLNGTRQRVANGIKKEVIPRQRNDEEQNLAGFG
jgi:hypothetical protein